MTNKMLLPIDSPSKVARIAIDQISEVDVEAMLIKFDNMFFIILIIILYCNLLIIVHAVLQTFRVRPECASKYRIYTIRYIV